MVEETPQQKVDILNQNQASVELVSQPTPESVNLYHEWQSAASWDVHSASSLSESRRYTLKLLMVLPEHKKAELTEKCVEQELKLQESIRLEDYSSHVVSIKVQKVVTYVTVVATACLLVLFMILPLVASWFKATVDKTFYETIAHLLEISFAALLLVVGKFWFHSKSDPRKQDGK